MSDDQPKPDESAFDFASRWYNADSVYGYIQRQYNGRPFTLDEPNSMPLNVWSREFANWLTNQYRLAMAKGIEIGLRMQDQVKAQKNTEHL